VSLRYPEAFDMLLIRQFCDQYRAKRNLTQTHTREDILCLTHLGLQTAGRFQPNLACALLFASDPRAVVPGARVRFMRFEGQSEGTGQKLTQIKDEYIDGPIPIQIQEAEQLITSQIRNFTRLGRDGRFYTQPEYPKDVWLEALVNS
jgi:ATP-dependent DNA helicase RecG